MKNFFKTKWDALKEKWSTAPLWMKVLIVLQIYPVIPTLMLLTAWFAPPEVNELLLANGQVAKELVGTAWQLCSWYFAEFLF